MKLIGKGQRHETTQAKVKLREVVEVAKTSEATTFANQLLKTAKNTQQEQVNYTTKSPSRHSVFGVAGSINSPVINIALQWGKNVENVVWPLRARMQGWNTMTSSTATIQFCL